MVKITIERTGERMKAKVIKKFIDKDTKVINEVNDVVELTKKRFDEINSVDDFLVEEKDDVKKTEPKKKAKVEKETKPMATPKPENKQTTLEQ